MTKQTKKFTGINPIAAAVAGAAVGAGIAIAGAMALKDKKNSDKVNKVLETAKAKVTEVSEKVQDQVRAKKTELEKNLAETQQRATKVVKTIKGSLYHDVAAIKEAAKK